MVVIIISILYMGNAGSSDSFSKAMLLIGNRARIHSLCVPHCLNSVKDGTGAQEPVPLTTAVFPVTRRIFAVYSFRNSLSR